MNSKPSAAVEAAILNGFRNDRAIGMDFGFATCPCLSQSGVTC